MHVDDTMSGPGIHVQAHRERGCVMSPIEGSQNDLKILRCEGGAGGDASAANLIQ